MSYIGHEPGRETLKYRCPAKHEGWECPMSAECNAGKSYGKTVRVPREVDPRRFPALPRATKKFERMYKGRTAVERVNARLKVFWGVDDGNLTGSRRFFAQVGVVLAVHAVFATLLAAAPRREGTLGKIGLSPIAAALRAAGRGGGRRSLKGGETNLAGRLTIAVRAGRPWRPRGAGRMTDRAGLDAEITAPGPGNPWMDRRIHNYNATASRLTIGGPVTPAGRAPDATDGYDPVPASTDLAAPVGRPIGPRPGSARPASQSGVGRVGRAGAGTTDRLG